MSRKFVIMSLLLGVFFSACKTETVNRKKGLKNRSKALMSDSCSAAVSSVMGATPTSQSSLSSLAIPSGAVIANASEIGVGGSQLAKMSLGAQKAMGPAFIMWKVCKSDGTQCTNDGTFQKSYNFNVSGIPDLPTGILQATIKACYDDLQFVTASDQVNAVNQCESAAPCYCGPETTVRFESKGLGKETAPQFLTAKKKLEKHREELYNTAVKYNKQAQACKDASDIQGHLRQYTTNIAALSAAEMASYVESYGALFASIMRASQTRGAGGQCTLLGDAQAASGDSSSPITPSGGDTPAVVSDAPGESTSASGTASDSNQSGGRSPKSYALMGLGSLAIVGGVIGAGVFGVIPTTDASGKTASLFDRARVRVAWTLDKGIHEHSRTLQEMLNAEIDRKNIVDEEAKKAKLDANYEVYSATRDQYIKDLDAFAKTQQEWLDQIKQARNYNKNGLTKWQQEVDRLHNAGLAIDQQIETAQQRVAGPRGVIPDLSPEANLESLQNQKLALKNQYDAAVYHRDWFQPSTKVGAEEKMQKKEFLQIIENEKAFFPEIASAEDFSRRAPELIKALSAKDRTTLVEFQTHLKAAQALDRGAFAANAVTDTPLPDKPASAGTKKMSTKKAAAGFAGSLAVVGAGIAATVAGSQLELADDGDCAGFGDVIAKMENQMYNQSQVIQEDLKYLSAFDKL